MQYHVHVLTRMSFLQNGIQLCPTLLTLPSSVLHQGPQLLSVMIQWIFFPFLFDSTLVGVIVTETIKYAKLCLKSERMQTTWSTTKEEIQAYFGFQILIGLNHKPAIRDYWSRDELLHYASIASRISRDRFEEISRYRHFVDKESLHE